MSQAPDVIVVGAGVSGLACARALSAAGLEPVVLERARNVGGRCSTRRLAGQPLDFGVTFLHGRDPAFLSALHEVPATVLEGWPSVIDGRGRPCNREAFTPGEHRLAYAEGVTEFPRHLASGVAVRTGVRVTAMAVVEDEIALTIDAGEPLTARRLVLALAPEQVLQLLATLADPSTELRSASALLEMVRSHACLSLLATYPEHAPRPSWHVSLPDDSSVVQLVSHDSSKRPVRTPLALVIQAHAAWSRAHLEDPAWPDALLREAASLHGGWIAAPTAVEPHRWRYARADRDGELAAPLWIRLAGGAALGITGDRFAPGGGVEGAWLAGRRLAARILEESRT